MSALYRINNLEKRRPGERNYRLLIRHLAISKGALLAITGPSGCGKSTALDILGFSLAPDSAQCFTFADQDNNLNILQMWQEARHNELASLRLSQVGYVLQSGELLPFLTAGENICLVARAAGHDEKETMAIGLWLAEKLGIASLWDAMPSTLSVGERQRAAIARALTSRPHVIIADEPTAALDPLHADKVMEVFLQCIGKFHSALVLATHNAAWARSGGLKEIKFTMLDEGGSTTALLDDDMPEEQLDPDVPGWEGA